MNRFLELQESILPKKKKEKISSEPERKVSSQHKEKVEAKSWQQSVFDHPSYSFSTDDEYSKPFYDTGEHVLAGEVVGHIALDPGHMFDINSVKFNYGHLMSMGDFYDTYDDMIKASATELTGLKKLIERSEARYKKLVLGKGAGGADVTHAEWEKATGGRYLNLAMNNFTHFAPFSALITPGVSSVSRPQNHKSEWEKYHKRAIDYARKGTNSNDLEKAYIINAFADHFLTDAFAAGHLFNKEAANAIFKSKVLAGGKLNAAGKTFFNTVGNKAFVGGVKTEFSKYETVEGYGPTNWHPNIDDGNAVKDKLVGGKMFPLLLMGIMEKQPDVLGINVVAKALHDALNNYPGGIPVKNNAGDVWKLTGDGTLNGANLLIMQKAVSQSVHNVSDAVTSSTTAHGAFFKKVWDITPQPDSTGLKIVNDLVVKFTDPVSVGLIDATVKLITANYQQLLDKLVAEKILRRA